MTKEYKKCKSRQSLTVYELKKGYILKWAMSEAPFKTDLYWTLLVNLKTRLGVFVGPFDFFELLDGGSSSSEASSILHS